VSVPNTTKFVQDISISQYADDSISFFYGPIFRVGEQRISNLERRQVNHLLNFGLCCFVSKLERLKLDCGRKSRPNFALFLPICKNEGRDRLHVWVDVSS